MEPGGFDSKSVCTEVDDEDFRSALNNTVLDYYKKFGRKRDLEQYFSLSTAQSEVRDPSSLFWRRMKAQCDSSDSGGKKSDSSTEVCRISIKCSIPEQSSSSQDGSHHVNTKPESVSPPIITEDIDPITPRHSDGESENTELNTSQKSIDAGLDTSIKPLSPTSSITSQRKLEWDSLADVGYANESDRKTSASSLSTLERLALKQQYSNNDNVKSNSTFGLPTAQSTPLDGEKETKTKSKATKGIPSKSTKYYKKDVDVLRVNMPSMDNVQAVNVNLTKHISFNVDHQTGKVIDNVPNNPPEKISVETEVTPELKLDKEIQTSLTKKLCGSSRTATKNESHTSNLYSQGTPVIISLNTLKRRLRNKKRRTIRKKRMTAQKNLNLSYQEKSGEQVSEAESFEYMPGHMYNQNKQENIEKLRCSVSGNKSSLESSGGITTGSSKMSTKSFTRELEKEVELLNKLIKQQCDNKHLKKKLVKDIVLKLIKSKYRDDESTTDFLSGLTFNSNLLGLGQGDYNNYTTTSTSDANNSGEASKYIRPKKSILRTNKLDSSAIASTTQSVPNLTTASQSDILVSSKLKTTLSNTETDGSSKERNSSHGVMTSSEKIYQKYLEALKREETYKKHLKDKEKFLRQKLVGSEMSLKSIVQSNVKAERINDLISDLTSKNYDDGSGDACKIGGESFNQDRYKYDVLRKHRSHSVFTLSSGSSDHKNYNNEKKGVNLKQKSPPNDIRHETNPIPSTSKDLSCYYCSCPYHKIGVADSAVQVNVDLNTDNKTFNHHRQIPSNITEETRRTTHGELITERLTGELKYVCFCTESCGHSHNVPDNFLIYKCSRLTDNTTQLPSKPNDGVNINNIEKNIFEKPVPTANRKPKTKIPLLPENKSDVLKPKKLSQFSQTNINLALKSINKKTSAQSSICIMSNEKRRSSLNSCHNTKSAFTRRTQTDITIDPKLSDPSLSDLNMITDTVLESYKDIESASESERNYENGSEINKITDKQESSSSEQLINEGFQTLIEQNKTIDTACQVDNFLNCDAQNFTENKYTIPLKGTNMALVVDIGDHNNHANDNVNQGVDTHGSKKATSLDGDYYKAVQSSDFNIPSSSDIYLNEQNNKIKKFRRLNEQSLIGDDKTEHNDNDCQTIGYNDPLEMVEKYISPREKAVLESLTKYVSPREMGKVNNETVLNSSSNYVSPREPKKVPQETVLDTLSNYMSPRELKKGTTETVPDSSIKYIVPRESYIASKQAVLNTLKKSAVNNAPHLGASTKYKTLPIKTPVDHKNTFFRRNTDSNILPSTSYVIGREAISNKLDSVQRPMVIFKENKDIDSNTCAAEMVAITSEKIASPRSIGNHQLVMAQKDIMYDADVREQRDIESDNSTKYSENTGTTSSDPIMALIKDITQRYTKRDVEKSKRKKCFKEVMSILNYLVDTDDNIGFDQSKTEGSTTTCDSGAEKIKDSEGHTEVVSSMKKTLVDKATQLDRKKKGSTGESSDVPISSDIAVTSTDSQACQLLNKIREECEKYHQKRSKSLHNKDKKPASSSTSVNCDKCMRTHRCPCKTAHKCKNHRSSKSTTERFRNKCFAYNLIIQTSDSLVSEETVLDRNRPPLHNIIVKVPSRRKNVPEKSSSKDKNIKGNVSRDESPHKFHIKYNRSRSLPNDSDVSSADGVVARSQEFTVRQYLEKNRPDFLEKSSKRQSCLKVISETRGNYEDSKMPQPLNMMIASPCCCMGPCSMYCRGTVPLTCCPCPYCQNVQSEVTRIANERSSHRQLLSLWLEREPDVKGMSVADFRRLAKDLGIDSRNKDAPSKFISEKEMKKHTEKIYKTLPEVLRKKEELKKESIKRTNLIMASLFKKHLQKKTLRGLVNLSNYSTVIKI